MLALRVMLTVWIGSRWRRLRGAFSGEQRKGNPEDAKKEIRYVR